MSSRPSRPCTEPGCPRLVPAGGRCPDCRRQAERRRGTAAQRGYGTTWQRRRTIYLTRHPTCILCGDQASVPDHWPLSRRQLVAMGVADPDTDEHLRPLCQPCHTTETAANQPGGFRT